MTAQPGTHYATQLGVPWFAADRRIKCSPKTAGAFWKDSRADEAKALCRECPRRDDCLNFAVAAEIDDGVWGGMTADERDAWARGEPIEPAPVRNRPTHCINGHELTDANVYHPPKRPTERQCRQCNRDRNNRHAAAKRLAAQQAAVQEADAA